MDWVIALLLCMYFSSFFRTGLFLSDVGTNTVEDVAHMLLIKASKESRNSQEYPGVA
jgi:hypothetical protein